MKQIIVGIYHIHSIQVELVLREGTGGEFFLKPEEGRCPRIKIGADQAQDDGWEMLLSILFHEVQELIMALGHQRFECSDTCNRDHAQYIFMFNHIQFSELCQNLAIFCAAALPDLANAWKKWNSTSSSSSSSSLSHKKKSSSSKK